MRNVLIVFGFLCFFCCTITSGLYAQEDITIKKRISFSEWVEEIINYKDSLYLLENTELYFDYEKDYKYSDGNRDTIFVEPEIVLLECTMFALNNGPLKCFFFKKPFSILKCEVGQIRFNNCRFRCGFNFNTSTLRWISFNDCLIEHRVIIIESNISLISFNNCMLQTDSRIVNDFSNNFGDLGIEKSYNYIFRVYQFREKINYFIIDNCTIKKGDIIPVLCFQSGNYESLIMNETDFNNAILDLNGISVEDNLIVHQCKFEKPVGMKAFNFPRSGTNFEWNQLEKNRICLWEFEGDSISSYKAVTDSELSDSSAYKFKELISSYKKLFSSYRTRGDMESANACYIAMKDIETRRLHYLSKTNPSIKNYFNWRLNQFLKYFCEYGTSPIRSLIISMWLILGFSLIYFFFYSDWDKINRGFFILKYKKLLHYFQSEQKLEDFYNEKHRAEFESYEEFKTYLSESKKKVPYFIRLLGKPLFRLSNFKHKIITFLYKRMEILSGRWADLKRFRKIFVGTVVSFTVVIYLIYLIALRSFNSLFLSINTFSTLGFGTIPVRGFSRYLAILEGFLGWFLLSIFSVSLINQILQN